MASSSPCRRRRSKPIARCPKGRQVWREYGALDYREWVADDVKVGKLTSFPRSVKLKPGETVVFAWITYKSRAQRDKINAKVMADPRLKEMMDPKEAAVRRQADDLWRLREPGESVGGIAPVPRHMQG